MTPGCPWPEITGDAGGTRVSAAVTQQSAGEGIGAEAALKDGPDAACAMPGQSWCAGVAAGVALIEAVHGTAPVAAIATKRQLAAKRIMISIEAVIGAVAPS